jgi:Tol biopolymer transport system component
MRRLALVAVIAGCFAVAPPAHATFPGENGKIAFVSSGSGEADGWFDVHTINPDGTGATDLDTPDDDRSVAWSPDGTKIAFTAGGTPTNQGGDLYVMNADGTGVVQLTDDEATDFDAAWSPDGTRILFLTGGDLFTIQPNGTGRTRLTNTPTIGERDPAWSPDGTKIVFDHFHDGVGDLYTINADGTGLVRITETPEGEEHPDWSPDGSKIVSELRDFRQGKYDIVVMNPDGSGRTFLTNNPPSTFDLAPVWSPDGRKIAFVRQEGGSKSLRTMNADGTGQISLSYVDAAQPDVSWQPLPLQPPPPPPNGHAKNAAKECKAEREADRSAFDQRYRNLGACVSERAKARNG